MSKRPFALVGSAVQAHGTSFGAFSFGPGEAENDPLPRSRCTSDHPPGGLEGAAPSAGTGSPGWRQKPEPGRLSLWMEAL